jgi:hypothetical protein
VLDLPLIYIFTDVPPVNNSADTRLLRKIFVVNKLTGSSRIVY